jgi:antitoxin component YwqK of YwqJK toxin-antitoxin module
MDLHLHHVLSLIREIIEPYLIRDLASIIVEMVPDMINDQSSAMTVFGKCYGKWTMNRGDYTEIGQYVHGLKHGSFKCYKICGNIYEMVYLYGSHIMTLVWDTNTGIMIERMSYKNNRAHGLWQVWSSDGQLLQETNYKMGLRHGMCTTWQAGGLLSMIPYVDDYRHGQAIVLRLDGTYEYDNHVYDHGRVVST